MPDRILQIPLQRSWANLKSAQSPAEQHNMSNQGYFQQHSAESPTNEMRNRRSTSYGTPPMSGAFPEGSDRGRSPSSTIFGSPVAGPPSAEPAPVPAWGMNSRPRNTVIKADPAMATCFDPSDAELYALWAPAR